MFQVIRMCFVGPNLGARYANNSWERPRRVTSMVVHADHVQLGSGPIAVKHIKQLFESIGQSDGKELYCAALLSHVLSAPK